MGNPQDHEFSRAPEPLPHSEGSSLGGSSRSSGNESSEPIQWLVTTRQQRSTAGNRMKAMLANDEPDSDLELLFAEDDDDRGFSDVVEVVSDDYMEFSSDDDDDDDHGNNVGGDDGLTGERELERSAKQQRLAGRKRKARDVIPPKFRKHVRIDPMTAVSAPSLQPQPRAKRKSERASWLPSAADLPTRSSARKTTRISKEHLHRQMAEREARRLKQVALMQKKAARLEALKAPPMTQANRLAEAALVEKRNGKSLNRWEEAEKQHEEGRRARLAALNNRTLDGPVITFWSGLREWKDALGQHVTVVETKSKRKREKAADKAKNNDAAGDAAPRVYGNKYAVVPAETVPPEKASNSSAPTGLSGIVSNSSMPTISPSTHRPSHEQECPDHGGSAMLEMSRASAATTPCAAPQPSPTDKSQQDKSIPKTFAAPLLPPAIASRHARPSGVLVAPVLAPPPGTGSVAPTCAPKSGVLAPPNTAQCHPPLLPPLSHCRLANRPSDTLIPVSLTPPAHPATQAPSQAQRPAPPHPAKSIERAPDEPPPPLNGSPSRGSTAAPRNAIIFRGFGDIALRDKTVQTQILLGRKMTKLSKPACAAHCAITGLPARYRDPLTSLPYHNAAAYREIRRLCASDYRWSCLIGAWAGAPTARPAHGVPDCFLRPHVSIFAGEGGSACSAPVRGTSTPMEVPPQPSPQPTHSNATVSATAPSQ